MKQNCGNSMKKAGQKTGFFHFSYNYNFYFFLLYISPIT